jgi:DNA polymerase elongation subunit (family B)
MSRLILDIETAGRELESLDEATQQYMLRGAETEEEIKLVRESLSFYPLTAEVVAIGLLNPDTGKGAVYFQQAPGSEPHPPFEEDGLKYEAGTEADILRKFWDTVKSYSQIVTYNGRGFDCPFLLARSAVHKIKPTKELMPNRYSDEHIDLMDRLIFFGAVWKRFSLDIWCRAMGIESPKSDITGYEVTGIFREGRSLDIARYCGGDLRATGELLERWENYMRFKPGGRSKSY